MANYVLTSPTASSSPGAATWALNSVRSSGQAPINAAALLLIPNTEVTSTSTILVSYEGATAGVGVTVSARVAGASFTVTTSAPVTGVINYAIIA